MDCMPDEARTGFLGKIKSWQRRQQNQLVLDQSSTDKTCSSVCRPRFVFNIFVFRVCVHSIFTARRDHEMSPDFFKTVLEQHNHFLTQILEEIIREFGPLQNNQIRTVAEHKHGLAVGLFVAMLAETEEWKERRGDL